MTKLKFEEPPEPQRGRASLEEQREFAKQLRARPGQWAVVTVRTTAAEAGQYAYTVRKGVRKLFQPAGTFEAVSRKVGDEHRVYARYVGEKTGE
jgi:hypothetical protein